MPLLRRFNSGYNQVTTDSGTKKPPIEGFNKNEEMKIEIEGLDRQKELYNNLLSNHRKELEKKKKNDCSWSDAVVVFASLILVGIEYRQIT